MSSPRRVVILGGGTGCTTVENRLRRTLRTAAAEITLTDRNDRDACQPGLLPPLLWPAPRTLGG